jgi:hypothetical protein
MVRSESRPATSRINLDAALTALASCAAEMMAACVEPDDRPPVRDLAKAIKQQLASLLERKVAARRRRLSKTPKRKKSPAA